MKRHLFPLIALCLLLSGCSRPAVEATVPAPVETEPVSTTAAPAGLYDPESPGEKAYSGALRGYPLSIPGVSGMKAMGNDLLLFSDTESCTLITRLSGDELPISASTQLSFALSPEDPSLQIADSSLSFYDPVNRQTVILDASLKEIRHIPAPEDLSGTPLLSADRGTLYYCTDSSIRGWDLETGIHRVIKEATFPEQSLTGLHLNDTILQCRVSDADGTDRTLLLSAGNGQLLYETWEDLSLSTSGSRYYAAFPTGSVQALLFGQEGSDPTALTPAALNATGFFLERRNAAVTACVPLENTLQLDYYDLDSGLRTACLELSSSQPPLAVAETTDGWVYLLISDTAYGREAIYRWDIQSPACAVSDMAVYTGTYYTVLEPDYHGLVWCQSYAEKIGQAYGIEVLLWEDALTVQPWDYEFQMEYLVPVLRQELTLLDQRLSRFPEGFLEATASHFDSLKICLVRSITGSAESGSLETATGVQFQSEADAYIVLAVGETSEKALYHELYHVMETHILGNSIALDQWSKLNPPDFAYDFDYTANTQRDGSAYLQPDTRSFVDTYSMSFPKEDRARIWEYAMIPGSEDLFAASPLQFKLKALCQGIREAYGLEKSQEIYPWEQYLVQPLAK